MDKRVQVLCCNVIYCVMLFPFIFNGFGCSSMDGTVHICVCLCFCVCTNEALSYGFLAFLQEAIVLCYFLKNKAWGLHLTGQSNFPLLNTS